jgi:beta-lactamase class C
MIKRTLPRILSFALALGSCPFAGLAQADSERQALASEFETYFQQHVAAEGITGAAFVIAVPDGILRTGAAGHTDTSKARRVDKDTVFRVASVSKTFAAGLTGLLVQEGRLTWDDRLVDHLPDFRIDGDSSQVRLLNLIGQSTGLVPHAYDNLIEDGVPMEQIMEKFQDLSYVCPPGDCYTYQNGIFSLIEPVIEKAASRPYARLMEERIFRPLDMRTASVGYQPFIRNPNRARPHVKSRGRWKTISVKPNYYRVAPAAGVNASAVDMGKWLTAQMGGRPAVIDPVLVETLIQPRVATVRDMRRKHWRDMLSDAHYGLGWRIYQLGEHSIAYHSGWVSGYRADLAWSDDHGIGIALLMNVESNSISEFTTTFWRMAFAQLAQPAPTAAASQVATLVNPTP